MRIYRHDSTARSSQIVVNNGYAYLSGIVSRCAEGQDTAQQTEDILAVIDAHLQRVGSSRSRLLTATIWLADIAEFSAMNAVWEAWIPAGCAPARATVQAALVDPKYKVEIMVVAALYRRNVQARGGSRAPGRRAAVHRGAGTAERSASL